MWTSRNRARYDRSKLRYPSDVTDEEWELMVPLIPPGKSGGGKRTVIMREVVNGLMYVLSTGCQWRAIPKDLPPKSTVYDYFDLWTYDGTLQRIHHALYEQCREQAQREASPTAAIIDSQSVKSAEKDAMGRAARTMAPSSLQRINGAPMPQLNDLSRSLVILEQDATLIAVIEMGQSNWLVAGIVPGVERSPLKKLAVDESALLKLLNRWREEAEKAGHRIERIAIAFEAGRDGFWLARWLRARGIEAHVIHASSVAVSREHRRAKTDRLDTELLKRAFLGWLRGERDHCKMVAIPTLAQEDAKRPNRERESLVGEQSRIVNRMKAALARLGIRGFNPKLKKTVERLDGLRMPEGEPIPPNTLAELKHDMERRRLVRSQIRDIEGTRLERLKQAPGDGPHVMVRLVARVIGVGVETADMLVQEVLSRNLRDRRAVARYGGLTGSPDESGKKRREKGLARSGNARVRRGMIQLAWRFLMFQKGSALAHWFYARTKNAPQTRKTMIVALARKLLIALWRLARDGAIPEGIVLRPAL